MKTTHEISHCELNQMVHDYVRDKGLCPKGKTSNVRLMVVQDPGLVDGKPRFTVTAIVDIEDTKVYRDD